MSMSNGLAKGAATGALFGFACGRALAPRTAVADIADEEFVECCTGYCGTMGGVTGAAFGGNSSKRHKRQGDQ